MANKKVQKAGKAAQSARSNPYVQRLIEDEDLRQNIVQAFESARDAYGRLSNGKSPATQVFEDKKLQKHIRETAGSVRDVSVGLYEAPKKQKSGGGFGRCCCSASSAARSRSSSPRGCARRCSTRCSVRRRSSSTPRPPPHQHQPARRPSEFCRGRPPGALFFSYGAAA